MLYPVPIESQFGRPRAENARWPEGTSVIAGKAEALAIVGSLGGSTSGQQAVGTVSAGAHKPSGS